jgi:hypothetical protein
MQLNQSPELRCARKHNSQRRTAGHGGHDAIPISSCKLREVGGMDAQMGGACNATRGVDDGPSCMLWRAKSSFSRAERGSAGHNGRQSMAAYSGASLADPIFPQAGRSPEADFTAQVADAYAQRNAQSIRAAAAAREEDEEKSQRVDETGQDTTDDGCLSLRAAYAGLIRRVMSPWSPSRSLWQRVAEGAAQSRPGPAPSTKARRPGGACPQRGDACAKLVDFLGLIAPVPAIYHANTPAIVHLSLFPLSCCRRTAHTHSL